MCFRFWFGFVFVCLIFCWFRPVARIESGEVRKPQKWTQKVGFLNLNPPTKTPFFVPPCGQICQIWGVRRTPSLLVQISLVAINKDWWNPTITRLLSYLFECHVRFAFSHLFCKFLLETQPPDWIGLSDKGGVHSSLQYVILQIIEILLHWRNTIWRHIFITILQKLSLFYVPTPPLTKT